MSEISSSKIIHELTKDAAMQPQEQLAKLHNHNKKLFIGIPKEITFQEKRIPLTPASVEFFSANGHTIWVEKDAGKDANFTDEQYLNAGAEIVSNHEKIFEADIILKIDPPTLREAKLMNAGQTLISALQLKEVDQNVIHVLMQSRVNAIAYEFLEDESGTLPIIRSMSELAGAASVLIAAEFLNNTHMGKGELLGGFTGIPPTEFVIIGAGAVGEYAARSALGLGATIKVFDNSVYRLRRIQENLGRQIYTSTVHPKLLSSALESADVVIGALRGVNQRSPIVVTEEMVMGMKPKSVIIDVAIDQGGIFETSEMTNHKNPVFKKHGVIHYCVPNIPSRISRTASYALSNIFSPLLSEMSIHGGFNEFIRINKGARNGVYTYRGNMTNKGLSERLKIKYKELDLLLGLYM